MGPRVPPFKARQLPVGAARAAGAQALNPRSRCPRSPPVPPARPGPSRAGALRDPTVEPRRGPGCPAAGGCGDGEPGPSEGEGQARGKPTRSARLVGGAACARFAGGITSVLTEPSNSKTWSGGPGAGGLGSVVFHSWLALLGLPGAELVFG